MDDLEKKIREDWKKYGTKKILRGGLGSFVECFYLGIAPTKNNNTEFDEVIQTLGLTYSERAVWEDMWNTISQEK